MDTILHHPAFGGLAFCLLSLWPLGHALRRAGLRPLWAGLIVFNLVMPMLGVALIAGIFCHRAWPKLPAPPKKQLKTSIWGQAS